MASPARVLVADDSALARAVVVRRLRAAGLEVVEKDTAAAASAVDPTGLACALLDLDLGDGWGTEVAAKLRAKRPTLPIAFFTTAAEGDALAKARPQGQIFSKPGELDDAVSWIEAHAAR